MRLMTGRRQAARRFLAVGCCAYRAPNLNKADAQMLTGECPEFGEDFVFVEMSASDYARHQIRAGVVNPY